MVGCVLALFSHNVPENTGAYALFCSKNILIFVEFEVQLAGWGRFSNHKHFFEQCMFKQKFSATSPKKKSYLKCASFTHINCILTSHPACQNRWHFWYLRQFRYNLCLDTLYLENKGAKNHPKTPKTQNSNPQLSGSKEEILWKKNKDTTVKHNPWDCPFCHHRNIVSKKRPHSKYHHFTPTSIFQNIFIAFLKLSVIFSWLLFY